MQEPIDKIWFDKLAAIHPFSLVGKLTGDPKSRLAKKEQFLANEIENPKFKYPRLVVFKIDRKRKRLEALRADIDANEESEIIKRAYCRLIDEKLSHLNILEAAQTEDDTMFEKLVTSEFGGPSSEVLHRLMPHVTDMLEKAESHDNELSSNAALRIKELILDIPTSDDPLFESFNHESEKTITASKIKKRFKLELANNNICDWSVTLDGECRSASIIIDQKSKNILIPGHRRVSESRLEALVKHEIGVHVMRRVNAESSTFMLLSAGLDHYIRGDEGLAKFEEHAIYPAALNSTIEMYFIAALVMGLAGKKMNFRETYNLFYDYYLASRHNKDGLSEKGAQNYGWNRAVRLFKGTTGQSRGICFTHDLAYMHGYIDLLKILESHPNEQNRFYNGKYDPANAFHRKLMDELEPDSK